MGKVSRAGSKGGCRNELETQAKEGFQVQRWFDDGGQVVKRKISGAVPITLDGHIGKMQVGIVGQSQGRVRNKTKGFPDRVVDGPDYLVSPRLPFRLVGFDLCRDFFLE